MEWIDGDWAEPFTISEAFRNASGWWLRFEREGVRDQRPGVYRLIALQDGNTLATIRRVCGDDPTGTLYIGATDCLRNRIGSLVQTHHPDFGKISTPHTPLSSKMAESFPIETLAISWEFSDDPWGRESELLRKYLDAFGELPPHNRR